MDTDDNEIPDVNDRLQVLLHQFEPLGVEKISDSGKTSPSDSSDVDDEEAIQRDQRLYNTAWCFCGKCSSMTTVKEYRNCITDHEAFIANCLNRHVLHVSMYEYMENVGPFDDNEPIHEIYRHIAYRRFVRWIWHRLGRHNRKILPACVVQKIRKTFPSEQYCGFKYARVNE
ncbi:P2X purinoceptor 7-like [Pecten maximus]|uniref:P2X purinoceptor 7-like n=1 Tax=Pecten maximus TaxID=6579 RepID=UPI00145818ED|nr:P2X purinoceptor 7-like [Pecten maximus]